MKGPYTGKLLKIDLTSKKITYEDQDENILRKYIGGRGQGAKLLYDLVPPNTVPLAPENVIVLTTGVLTGTISLFSSRTNITTKSPLTDRICMGNCGGFFGPELKFAGFDGIIITGRSEKLCYIWINNGEVHINECEDLKGKTSTETENRLLGMTDTKSRVLCTGPAAEIGVKTACVYGDHRFIGRGGTGAVFGSKNLKGIVVRGTKTNTIPVVHTGEFSKIIDEEKKLFKENEFFQLWRGYGTPFIVTPMNSLGLLGTNNFQGGEFDSHEQINGDTLKNNHVKKKITCHRCPVACISLSEVKDGDYAGASCRGPEFETIYAFGSSCGNSSLPSIIRADQLCTEYGMDTISTGNICAFAMELFERGILTKNDTDGIEFGFGNDNSLIKLVHMIGRREGIGDVLAEGVKAAAEKIGNGAEKYAMHVKGLELAAYDPRGAKSQGLAYATSPRGGCHHTGYAEEELYNPDFDRFTNKGKPEVAMRHQDQGVMYDSTGICSFPTQLGVVGMDTMSRLLYNAAGFDEFKTEDDLMDIGERIFNLERLFNWREGMTTGEDTLPERFIKEPLKSGASEGQTVELAGMLKEYYELRGWSAEGKPTEKLLQKLGIN